MIMYVSCSFNTESHDFKASLEAAKGLRTGRKDGVSAFQEANCYPNREAEWRS